MWGDIRRCYAVVKDVGKSKKMYEAIKKCKLQLKSYIKRNETGPNRLKRVSDHQTGR